MAVYLICEVCGERVDVSGMLLADVVMFMMKGCNNCNGDLKLERW